MDKLNRERGEHKAGRQKNRKREQIWLRQSKGIEENIKKEGIR